MLDLGGVFHHTCVLRNNIFWSSAINLGLTVTTKRGGRTKCSGWTSVWSRAKAASIGGLVVNSGQARLITPSVRGHMMLPGSNIAPDSLGASLRLSTM